MISKKSRLLYIFYKLMRGERINIGETAEKLGISDKSLYRDVKDIKAVVSELSDAAIPLELQYNRAEKTFSLTNTGTIEGSTLLAIIVLVIGSRAFGAVDLGKVLDQLRRYAVPEDEKLLNNIISNEYGCYNPLYHDNEDILDMIGKISRCIQKEKEINIGYYKTDREHVIRRVRPLAITYADFYFYMCGVEIDEQPEEPMINPRVKYFRIDRITDIVVHRQKTAGLVPNFDIWELKQRIQLMQPGRHRKITFEFSGPSVQAILDKFPVSRITGTSRDGKTYTITAGVYGRGATMFLLSQGSWVKALAPKEFVDEMQEEIEKMRKRYVE